MPRLRRKQIAQLPQRVDTWILVIRQLRLWLKDGDDVVQPLGLVCFDQDERFALGYAVLTRPPTAREVLGQLFSFMAAPAESSGFPPGRPARVVVEDKELAKQLRPMLKEVEVQTIRLELPEPFEEFYASFEGALAESSNQVEGLLEAEGMTPAVGAAFFAASADYYRAEPWVALSNSQTLAISFPPGDETWYVTVMGQGGVDYGMVIQRTWEQVLELFRNLDDPIGGLPKEGWHAVSYEPRHVLPFDDLEAIEAHAWEVAGPEAYPFPVIFDRDRANRPAGVELQLWERLMRAVVGVVDHGLAPDGAGDYQPLEIEVELPAASGGGVAKVRYPAGDRDRADQARKTFVAEAGEEGAGRRFDRRAMEGLLADLTGAGDSDVDKAQQVMYKAWDEPDAARRIEMAEMALELSPDCADAYVLLAEERAKTVGEALELYQKGVSAGERALGDKPFKKDVGYFWGLLETRPYMRARLGLANCLWDLNRTGEAEAHYRDMLRLNPNDNQGVRYVLLNLLLDIRKDGTALDLIETYPDDPSARIVYNKALLLFRQAGPRALARSALVEALICNPEVPPYLLGRKRVPARIPDLMGLGDESEAMDYAAVHLNHWRETMGALDWLQEIVESGT